jgi:quercetin dioxygenase-like cupin family protein
MRKGWKLFAPALFAAAVLSAQTSLPDSPQAHVLAVDAQGKQPASPLNRVVIVLKTGEIRWIPAGEPFQLDGVGEQSVRRIVEIELKNKPATPPPPLSKLDAVRVDSRHYKIEFENEQVRVLRVHYEAHEKGVLHEHLLNRVVCYLNDQGNMKAGGVRMAGPATHTEENTGDQPAERIAVELK